MPPRAAREAPRSHLREVDTPLPVAVQRQLITVLHQREQLEGAMAETDLNVYAMETAYLGLCVELGGSLFDGFGLERSTLVHAGGTTAGSPRSAARLGLGQGSPLGLDSVGGGGGRGFPASPLAEDDALLLLGETGATTTGGSGLPNLAANIVGSNLAFRARVHSFSPAERVFSSSSVGAIGRVERLKASGRNGSGSAVARTATAAGATNSVGASTGYAAQGAEKGLWASAGRRRSGRGTGDEDDDDDGSAHDVGATLYTTTGRRKRGRETQEAYGNGDSKRGGADGGRRGSGR